MPRYTTWFDHGEEYEQVMSNRAYVTFREEMKNMLNDGLGGICRNNDEEPNAEAKTFYRMLKHCEKILYTKMSL